MRKMILPAIAFLAAAPAFALPGEADAVIRHCGEPHAQNFTTSDVTNRPQRDLIYKNVTLHFEPQEGGWSFTTAWQGHFPVLRSSLEEKLPCFRAAIREVAAAQPNSLVDPTIAAQTTTGTPVSQAGNFGIPHLWLIICLVGITILLVLIPRRRARLASRVPEVRPYRRPTLRSRIWRRRPIVPPLP